MQESSQKKDPVIVRPIANEDELVRVHHLTHDAYVASGYATPQPNRRLVHYGDFDHLPETTILVALRGNEIIGTASITIDGAWGLTIDKDFKRVCDSLRYAGRSLAVVWRLVIANSENSSRQVLMALIQYVIDLNAMQGASTTLVTVNPKHQSAYERLFKATVLSTNSFTKGLDQAPGVLMRMDYEKIPETWRRLAPKIESGQAA